MKTHTRQAFITIAASAVLAVAIPAAAGDKGVKISTDGLDLTTRADAEVLYTRIRQAARALCTAAVTTGDGKRFSKRRDCIEETVDESVDRFNQPMLTAVHQRSAERVASR